LRSARTRRRRRGPHSGHVEQEQQRFGFDLGETNMSETGGNVGASTQHRGCHHRAEVVNQTFDETITKGTEPSDF